MTEESPSKIKIKKVLKIVDKFSRIVMAIFFVIVLYMITAFASVFIEFQPTQAVLITAIVVNSLISLMIYCRMD